MPVFYHLPFGLLCGLVFTAFWTFIFALFIHLKWKVRLIWQILTLVTLAVVCLIIGVGLSNKILFQLQASVAVEYIQSSLDKDCDNNIVTTSQDGFYISDGYQWSSSDKTATCYFNNVEWICSCSH